MPIYEYACENCGAVEEVLQKFSDKPLSTCPKCRGRMHKLISQSSFHLKGSGWYVTDYAKKSSSSTGNSTPHAKTDADADKTSPKTDDASPGTAAGTGGTDKA